MMDRSFIEAVAEGAHKPTVLALPGYQPVGVMPAGQGSMKNFPLMRLLPSALKFDSLTSLHVYIADNVDNLTLSDLMLVVDATNVSLMNALQPELPEVRRVHAHAVPYVSRFEFGKYQPLESFMVGLRTNFVRTEVRDALLATLSMVKDSNVRDINDDGMSQEVLTGSAIKARMPVPPSLVLAPFRTFREVDQPESEFILRLRRGDGDQPDAALFDADFGLWQHEATQRVRKWLRESVSKEVSVV